MCTCMYKVPTYVGELTIVSTLATNWPPSVRWAPCFHPSLARSLLVVRGIRVSRANSCGCRPFMCNHAPPRPLSLALISRGALRHEQFLLFIIMVHCCNLILTSWTYRPPQKSKCFRSVTIKLDLINALQCIVNSLVSARQESDSSVMSNII